MDAELGGELELELERRSVSEYLAALEWRARWTPDRYPRPCQFLLDVRAARRAQRSFEELEERRSRGRGDLERIGTMDHLASLLRGSQIA